MMNMEGDSTSTQGTQGQLSLATDTDTERGKMGKSKAVELDPEEIGRRKIPLDRGWAWVIIFSSFVIQFIGDGVPYSFGLVFVKIAREFSSAGHGAISAISSIQIALTHAVGPFASILVNRFGCRSVSFMGSTLAALGYGTSYFAQNVPTLYATLGIIGGIGFGLMYLPAIVIIPQYFHKKRALATGIAVSGSGLGTFAFEWIFGFILTVVNWRSALAIGSGIICFSAFFALFYRPGPNSGTETENHGSDDSRGGNTDRKLSAKSITFTDHTKKPMIDLTLLRCPAFMLFSLCDVMVCVGFFVPYVYLPEIEETRAHATSSSVLGLIGVFNVMSRLVFGYINDKPCVNRLYVYTGAVVLAGAGTILSPHFTSIWWLRAYAGLFGACMGARVCVNPVILLDLVGLGRITDAFGLLLLMQSFGFLIGPPVVGYLYDLYGIYNPGFYFAGVMMATSGVLVSSVIPAVIRRTKAEQIRD